MDQRFEHMFTVEECRTVESKLEDMEKDGWELVAVTEDTEHRYSLFFKRPIPPMTLGEAVRAFMEMKGVVFKKQFETEGENAS